MTFASRAAMTARSGRARTPLGATVAIVLGAVFLRRWQLRWGATDAEVAAELPGDELLRADRSTTRAVTIDAPAREVWPWLVQMGQGRGGFYSYDLLENFVGCDIHSATRVVDEWQHVAVGDPFRLHPDIALEIVAIEANRALVVRGGVPMGDVPPPYDCTWAFVLTERADGTTRLVSRERYAFAQRWAALIVEPVTVASFVMTRKMLHGIRTRAEGRSASRVPGTTTPSALAERDLLAHGV
jgi:hypothetical protein